MLKRPRSCSPDANTNHRQYKEENPRNNININADANSISHEQSFLLNFTQHRPLLDFLALRRDVTIVEETTPYIIPTSDSVRTDGSSLTHSPTPEVRGAPDTVHVKKHYLCVPEVVKLVPEYISMAIATMERGNNKKEVDKEVENYTGNSNKVRRCCFETFLGSNSNAIAGELYPADPLYLLLLVEAALVVSGSESTYNNDNINTRCKSNKNTNSSTAEAMMDNCVRLLRKLLVSCPLEHCGSSHTLATIDKGPLPSATLASALDTYCWPNIVDSITIPSSVIRGQTHDNDTSSAVKGGDRQLFSSGSHYGEKGVRGMLLRLGNLYDFWKINSLFSPSCSPSDNSDNTSPPVIITSMSHLILWRKARERHIPISSETPKESPKLPVEGNTTLPSLSFHVSVQLITYECTVVGMLPLSDTSDTITSNAGSCKPFSIRSMGEVCGESSDEDNDVVVGLNKQRTEYWCINDGAMLANDQLLYNNDNDEGECVNGMPLKCNAPTSKGVTSALCLDLSSLGTSLTLNNAKDLITRGGVSNTVTSAMLAFAGIREAVGIDVGPVAGIGGQHPPLPTIPHPSKALLSRLTRSLISLSSFTARFGPLASPFSYPTSQASYLSQSTRNGCHGRPAGSMEALTPPTARWYLRTGVGVTAVCIDSFVLIPQELGDLLDRALLLQDNSEGSAEIIKSRKDEEEESDDNESDPIKQYRDALSKAATSPLPTSPNGDISGASSKALFPGLGVTDSNNMATELFNIQIPFPNYTNNTNNYTNNNSLHNLIDLHRYGRTVVVPSAKGSDLSSMHNTNTCSGNISHYGQIHTTGAQCISPSWLTCPLLTRESSKEVGVGVCAGSASVVGVCKSVDSSAGGVTLSSLSPLFIEGATQVIYTSGLLSSILINDEIEQKSSNMNGKYNNISNDMNNNNSNNNSVSQTEGMARGARRLVFSNVNSNMVVVNSISKGSYSFPIVSFSFGCDGGNGQVERNVFYVLHGPRVETDRTPYTFASHGGGTLSNYNNNNNNNNTTLKQQLAVLESQTIAEASKRLFSSLTLYQQTHAKDTMCPAISSVTLPALPLTIVPTTLTDTQLESIKVCLSRCSSTTTTSDTTTVRGMTVVDIIRAIPAFSSIVDIINSDVYEASAEVRAKMIRKLKDTVGKGLRCVAQKVGNKGKMPVFMLKMG